jgi:hypothetical protein
MGAALSALEQAGITMRFRIGTVLVLILCLGTALAISGRDEDSSVDIVGAAERKSDGHPTQSDLVSVTNARFDLASLRRHIPKAGRHGEMFDSKSWYVPPPVVVPQVVNLPPPPPSAPPMPFTYIGRMIDRGDVTLFLGRNGHQYTVRKGDVIEEAYRIDEIGSTEVVLTHLPTNTRQTLLLGSTVVGSKSVGEAGLAGATGVSEFRPPLPLIPNIK